MLCQISGDGDKQLTLTARAVLFFFCASSSWLQDDVQGCDACTNVAVCAVSADRVPTAAGAAGAAAVGVVHTYRLRASPLPFFRCLLSSSSCSTLAELGYLATRGIDELRIPNHCKPRGATLSPGEPTLHVAGVQIDVVDKFLPKPQIIMRMFFFGLFTIDRILQISVSKTQRLALPIAPVCASPICRHYSGHRHY